MTTQVRPSGSLRVRQKLNRAQEFVYVEDEGIGLVDRRIHLGQQRPPVFIVPKTPLRLSPFDSRSVNQADAQ